MLSTAGLFFGTVLPARVDIARLPRLISTRRASILLFWKSISVYFAACLNYLDLALLYWMLRRFDSFCHLNCLLCARARYSLISSSALWWLLSNRSASILCNGPRLSVKR